MCLAIPVRVTELLADQQAMVDLGGVRKEISLALLDGVQVGDYVILHVGYALTRLDIDEAERTLALFALLPPPDRGRVGEGVESIPATKSLKQTTAAAQAAAEAAAAHRFPAAVRPGSSATSTPSADVHPALRWLRAPGSTSPGIRSSR